MTSDGTPSSDELEPSAKQRIRLEELYRHEVRRQLDSKVNHKSAVHQFLNSSFGLWLLSAVFITGAGAAYGVMSKHVERAALRTATSERLDLEISFRYYEILTILRARVGSGWLLRNIRRLRNDLTDKTSVFVDKRELTQAQRKQLADDLDALEERMRRTQVPSLQADGPSLLLRMSPSPDYRNLFPEYSSTPLPALLALLREQSSSQEQEQIAAVLTEIARTDNNESDQELGIHVKKKMMLDRWKTMSSLFLNCPENDPLCVGGEYFLQDPQEVTLHSYDAVRRRVCMKTSETDIFCIGAP